MNRITFLLATLASIVSQSVRSEVLVVAGCWLPESGFVGGAGASDTYEEAASRAIRACNENGGDANCCNVRSMAEGDGPLCSANSVLVNPESGYVHGYYSGSGDSHDVAQEMANADCSTYLPDFENPVEQCVGMGSYCQ